MKVAFWGLFVGLALCLGLFFGLDPKAQQAADDGLTGVFRPPAVPIRPPMAPGAKWAGKINLEGPITSQAAMRFMMQLDAFDRAGMDLIFVEIDSPGGSVWAGFQISKAIERADTKIVCIVDGGALSMGAYILESCPVRIMTKRSRVMFHNPKSGPGDDMQGYRDIWNNLMGLRSLSEAMLEHYWPRTKLTKDEFGQHLADGKDWWVLWSEALKLGIVDAVYRTSKEAIQHYGS